MKKNVVNWFEIPVSDMERAKGFYAGVLGKEMMDVESPGEGQMSTFPSVQGGQFASGALFKHPDSKPGGNGTIVYFHCEDVALEAGRVEANGGKLVQPKMAIGPHGFIAMAMDTEGNMIGFHSVK